jgi:hypothetical protein
MLDDVLSSDDFYRNKLTIDNLLIYLRCYTIIKYMSIENAKYLMTKVTSQQFLHDQLSEYHRRLRGTHTKGAVH